MKCHKETVLLLLILKVLTIKSKSICGGCGFNLIDLDHDANFLRENTSIDFIKNAFCR